MSPIKQALNSIKELKRVSVSAELTEADYYYSESMLRNGILFEVYMLETLFEEEFTVMETYVTVCLCDLPETFFYATEYTIYTGPLLSGIQIHRMIKDLFDLYLAYPLTGQNNFVEVLEDMCMSSRSSASQKSGTHKKLTYYEIKKKVTRLIKYEADAEK